jgi:hypothetical protein
VKAWLEDVAEDGVRLRDECVTRGLFGAVWGPPFWVVVVTAGLVAERSTGVVVNLNWRPGPSRPALFGDLLWNALCRPPASTRCRFRRGKLSRGSSFGDFGTLTLGSWFEPPPSTPP